jgi:hypothetical protein
MLWHFCQLAFEDKLLQALTGLDRPKLYGMFQNTPFVRNSLRLSLRNKPET